jgi:hypothetical protein
MNKKQYPKLNIALLIQRANDLVFVCRNDRLELETVGMRWELVEQIAVLLKECSDAEALWKLVKENNSHDRTRYRQYVLTCRKLRARLAENIRFVFKKSGSNAKLPVMWKKVLPEEIIQDLNDLACICNLNKELFTQFNFNFALANIAAIKSKELSERTASLQVECETAVSKQFSHRYTIYTELTSKIKEICSFGRIAFSEVPDRRKNYYAIR